MYDSESGTLLRELAGHRGSINQVVASRDGRYLATCSDDTSVLLWDGLVVVGE